MASQITGVLIVYSTLCSGANQRNHKSGKCFHLMMSSCVEGLYSMLLSSMKIANALSEAELHRIEKIGMYIDYHILIRTITLRFHEDANECRL